MADTLETLHISGAQFTDGTTLNGNVTVAFTPAGTIDTSSAADGGVTGVNLTATGSGGTTNFTSGYVLSFANPFSGSNTYELTFPASTGGSYNSLYLDFTGETPTTLDQGGQSFYTSIKNGNGTAVLLGNTGTVDTTCFVAGTKILTKNGEVPVEQLGVGELVTTHQGEATLFQPVKWIGWRRINLAAHPRPETVAPIRIQQGAFADMMPHRDLLVSPDHAIYVDGKLICARQLVNGTTIRQEQGRASVDYFHVELDEHAILLSEGLATESYLDTGNRDFFANAGAPQALHPDLTSAADHPLREAASCAPFVWQEEGVKPVWHRLAERAAALGHPVPTHASTTDPDLCLVAQGQILRPLSVENGLHRFIVPAGITTVQLLSRAAAPTEIRPWIEDRRRLGVYVERIVARSGQDLREIPVDHPDLSTGWWAAERDGNALRRWTDGNATLPLPTIDASLLMLEIRASSSGMTYRLETEQQRRAA